LNKIIRVLHTEWSDGWGGQEIRIISEMLSMRNRGVEVFLACRKNSTIKHKALENKIPVFTLPFRGNLDLISIFKLISLIRKNKINIVNTHSGKDTWVGGLAAKISGIKFIRTRHLSNLINSSRLNFINEIADYIFTTGESVKLNMIKFNRIKPEKIQSIPTGVDSKIFNPNLFSKKTTRIRLGIKEGEICIGIVAVLRDSKRHDNFLKIAQMLKNKYSNRNFKFLIVGDGPYKENIERNVQELSLEDDVMLIGHVENVAEVMSAIDIFLFTADRREGVPQVLIQALMMDLKVVSTDDGSIVDLKNGENFLISSPEISMLFSNACKAVENYSKTDFLRSSRNHIVDHFSSEASANKILKIYREILHE